ncbi:acetyl esterase/lipase [Limnobacter thiooxidans]|uniref:Alpha/beta hydrolase n=1 Tax=Limnobacter thiooxidans TaxID=131080 RepID=A0AA86IZH3_9BURK|nr:acetyl esterase/lipase [Limnobacter thiooxidans]BET26552.1 alpha/beta hydrolase [Limnobacter thiooxidans]
MRKLISVVIFLLITGTNPVFAQEKLNSEYKYGLDLAQEVDFYPLLGKPQAPLVVFVHGGGWVIGDKAIGTRNKPAFYHQLGFAFASVNYRLLSKSSSRENQALSPNDQASDVAAAVGYLRNKAAQLGFDSNNIVLMGHSAGAHLAALVSANPSYLETAGVPMSAVKGVILLDGAGYDVNRQMDAIANSGRKNRWATRMYESAFGLNPKVRQALSPFTHARQPNVASWLILHVADREDSRDQSEALGNELNLNGSNATVLAVPDSSHRSVNQDAGSAESFVGKAISTFLSELK